MQQVCLFWLKVIERPAWREGGGGALPALTVKYRKKRRLHVQQLDDGLVLFYIEGGCALALRASGKLKQQQNAF